MTAAPLINMIHSAVPGLRHGVARTAARMLPRVLATYIARRAATSVRTGQSFLVLGGAGLVGTQVCRQLARELVPSRIVVTDLDPAVAESAVAKLQNEFRDVHGSSDTTFTPAWGNIFVPTTLAHLPTRALIEDAGARSTLLKSIYGDFDRDCYADNHMKKLIEEHKPDVIVDCVNTATGLAYQDVFTGAANMLDWIDNDNLNSSSAKKELEVLLLSQSVPELIRHVKVLHRATMDNGTQMYLKVGTTGTGGMGLNIPYTHSEDRPSGMLLAKNEAAFGHTGLLFLLGRTPGAPIVKEIKPAAMIGYRDIRVTDISDKNGNSAVYHPMSMPLVPGDSLRLKDDKDSYTPAGPLQTTVVCTGENGNFARGEFGVITAMGQMEFLTPEEIASVCVEEIRGINTGKDFVNACDSTVMGSTYKAGVLRDMAIRDITEVEDAVLERGGNAVYPSVALGKLGPPELSKLLMEARLLRETYGTVQGVVRDDEGRLRNAEDVARDVQETLARSRVRQYAPSIGVPILTVGEGGGLTLVRGPNINIPETGPHRPTVELSEESVDQWARKGWVDLRATNMDRWLSRCEILSGIHSDLKAQGTAAVETHSFYKGDPTSSFEEGDVVSYILNNEFGGSRMK